MCRKSKNQILAFGSSNLFCGESPSILFLFMYHTDAETVLRIRLVWSSGGNECENLKKK